MPPTRSAGPAGEPALVADIVCPHCTAPLAASADVCPHCGHATAETKPRRAAPSLIDRPWLIVLVVLHVGVLGIPLYWKTRYSWTTRVAIIAVSFVYTVGAVAAIGWGSWKILQMIQGL